MNFLSDELIGQLVVIVLLLFVTLRSLLKKTQHTETIAILSVIALFVNILLILIYGVSFILILMLCLSTVVLITNIATLYRLANSLYTARNTFLFYFSSYVEAFFAVICLIGCVYFMPQPYNTSLQTKYLYNGSFSRGFYEKESLFEKTNLIVTEYKKEDSVIHEGGLPAVVYVTSIGTVGSDSALRLSTMAEMGLTVYSAEFFAVDAPKTGTSIDKNVNNNPVVKSFSLHNLPSLTNAQKESFKAQKAMELEVLLTIVGQSHSSVLLVAEGDCKEIALQARQKYSGFVSGVIFNFQDDVLEEYYGKGIADYAMLNPLDAYLTKFDSWEDFKYFQAIGKTEKPHLRIARLVLERAKDITGGVKNDTL